MSCNDKCVLDFVDIACSKIIALLYNYFIICFICPLMFVISVKQNTAWWKIMALLHEN